MINVLVKGADKYAVIDMKGCLQQLNITKISLKNRCKNLFNGHHILSLLSIPMEARNEINAVKCLKSPNLFSTF